MSEGDLSLIGDEFVLRSSGDGFYADGDICFQARKISVEAEGDAIYTETGNVTVLECGALKLTGANGIVVGEGSTEGTVDLSQSDGRDLTATITATKGSAIRTKGDVLLLCAAILTGAVHAIEAKNVNCAANAEVLYAVGESASAIKVTNTVEFCSNESYIQGKTYGIEVVGDPDTVLDLNGGGMHIEGETAVANVGMKVPAATLIDDTAVSAVDPSGKYASIAPAVGKSLKYLEPEYEFLITVADTKINAQNCDNVLSGTENDGKVSYDPFTRTLSLKDAKIEALSAFAIRFWSDYPMTIHLTGENTLTTSTKFEWYSSLIHSDAGLRLTGEGKLVLTAGLYADGIDTDADLIVDGPHITVVSSLNGLDANRLDVASGILDITSAHTAVGTAEYVRITDSTVNITAEARGLDANLGDNIALGNIYISNTALTVNAGLCGIRGDDLHVTSSTLDITALSDIEVTDCAITDSVCDFTSDGIALSVTDLVLSSSQVNINAESHGILSLGAVTFESGTLDIAAGSVGILTNDLTVNGGNININSQRIGIHASKKANFNNGKTVVYGEMNPLALPEYYNLGPNAELSYNIVEVIPTVEPIHRHSWAENWTVVGTAHWKACLGEGECDEGGHLDFATHTGGTAKPGYQAICEICGHGYGDYAEAQLTLGDGAIADIRVRNAIASLSLKDAGAVKAVNADLIGFDATIKTARVSSTMLNGLAENGAETFAVHLETGSITLDAAAIKSLGNTVKRNNLEITLDGDSFNKLNVYQRKAISGCEVLDIYRVTLRNADTYRGITSFEGELTVSVPFDASGYDAEKISVWAINGVAKRIRLESSLENGELTWVTDSLNNVVILYDAE